MPERAVWIVAFLLIVGCGWLFFRMMSAFGFEPVSPMLFVMLPFWLLIFALGWMVRWRRRKQTLDVREYEARMERLAGILDWD